MRDWSSCRLWYRCYRVLSTLPSRSRATVLVTSYSFLRRDIDSLSGIHWATVVLDEGHVIQNPGSALFAAVETLKADFRVVLTGTPIQNRVLDMWTTFDFLMPGYLGTHADFQRRWCGVCADVWRVVLWTISSRGSAVAPVHGRAYGLAVDESSELPLLV